MIITCPCCRRRVEGAGEFLFDWSSGAVATAHGLAHLTATESDIFAYLARTPGVAKTYDAIINAVSGFAGDGMASGTLMSHICNMRKTLRPIGVNIGTRLGAYVLEGTVAWPVTFRRQHGARTGAGRPAHALSVPHTLTSRGRRVASAALPETGGQNA